MDNINLLFSLSNKKSLTIEEMSLFKEILISDKIIINTLQEDFFSFRNNRHLLENSLYNNNLEAINIILSLKDNIDFNKINNLHNCLAFFYKDVEIFNIFFKYIKPELLDKFITNCLQFNKNHSIVNKILNLRDCSLIYDFQNGYENYKLISDFYNENNKFFNIISLKDNSVNYYLQNLNISKKEITDVIECKIKFITTLKNEKNIELIKNRNIYVKDDIEKDINNKIVEIKEDIFFLSSISNDLFYTYKNINSRLNISQSIGIIEKIFTKKNFFHYMNDETIINIAKFMAKKVTRLNPNFIRNYKNNKYFLFFKYYKLNINTEQYIINNILKQSNINDIEEMNNIFKLIETHNINNIDIDDSNKLINLLFPLINKNNKYHILLQTLKPNPDYNKDKEIHFFIKNNDIKIISSLIEFYKTSTQEILDSIYNYFCYNKDYLLLQDNINKLLNYLYINNKVEYTHIDKYITIKDNNLNIHVKDFITNYKLKIQVNNKNNKKLKKRI